MKNIINSVNRKAASEYEKVIVYYSYRGNTKSIAEMIQKGTGADIARIETVVPYDGDYNSIVNQGQDEVNSGYCPEIKPLNIDLSKYDEVILGTPVWWYTFAPAMHTFLKENDLSGKTVYPFATNGGWIGHTFKDFANACGTADVKQEMNIRFDESVLRTPKSEIQNGLIQLNKPFCNAVLPQIKTVQPFRLYSFVLYVICRNITLYEFAQFEP